MCSLVGRGSLKDELPPLPASSLCVLSVVALPTSLVLTLLLCLPYEYRREDVGLSNLHQGQDLSPRIPLDLVHPPPSDLRHTRHPWYHSCQRRLVRQCLLWCPGQAGLESRLRTLLCPTRTSSSYLLSPQAVLALIALAYFLLSTGPTTIFKVLPWWILLQLGLDALMFIFWLSAAATSRYNCDDLCNACSGWDSVSFDDLSCSCLGSYYYWYKKRSMSPNKNGLLQPRRTGHSNPTGTYGAKRGLDSVMV